MKKHWVFQVILVSVILASAVAVTMLLMATKPEPDIEPPEKILPVVEVMEVEKEDVALTLPSQGIIEPDRTTRLAAEVSGRIISVADTYEVGRAFQKGDVLMEIDPADYQAALAQVQSDLEDAELTLQTEEALAEKALRDWEELNLSGDPSDLTLRKPQVGSARARVKALTARVEQAKRDVERTKIRAPYNARLESISTNLGAYVTPGQVIADVHSLAPYEVRLPLSLDDFSFVDAQNQEDRDVRLMVEIAGELEEWTGKIVRQEGQVDRGSRSVYTIAEVSPEDDTSILQPGLFVRAEIEGKVLSDVARIPLEAFYDLERIVLLDEDNRLRFQKVQVLRRQSDVALVGDGLNAGDRICLTALDAVVEGMEVEIRTEGVLEDAASTTITSTEEPQPGS